MKSPGKILVIEDNDDIREIIKDLLELQGFNVLEASNGPRGIRMAIKEMPKLILCDIMMPKMDGFEVFLSLREVTHLREIPFLFVTAKSDSSTYREAMNLGADDFIVKPFSASDLLEAVSTRLDKSENVFKQLEGKLERVAINRVNNIELDSIKVSSELLIRYGKEMSQKDLLALHSSIHGSAQRISQNKENFEIYEIINTSESADMALGLFFNDEPKPISDIFDQVRKEQIFSDRRSKKLNVDLENVIPDLPASLLKKILLELVDNATKYSLENTTIRILGFYGEDEYHLAIDNEGEEFRDELKKELKPFVSLDADKKVLGVGIGLYIVRKLCKQFNIGLQLLSPRKGTNRVELRFPIS